MNSECASKRCSLGPRTLQSICREASVGAPQRAPGRRAALGGSRAQDRPTVWRRQRWGLACPRVTLPQYGFPLQSQNQQAVLPRPVRERGPQVSFLRPKAQGPAGVDVNTYYFPLSSSTGHYPSLPQVPSRRYRLPLGPTLPAWELRRRQGGPGTAAEGLRPGYASHVGLWGPGKPSHLQVS